MPAGMPNMGKTGSASIEKLGHTSVNRHGRDPHKTAKGSIKPTEERAK